MERYCVLVVVFVQLLIVLLSMAFQVLSHGKHIIHMYGMLIAIYIYTYALITVFIIMACVLL